MRILSLGWIKSDFIRCFYQKKLKNSLSRYFSRVRYNHFPAEWFQIGIKRLSKKNDAYLPPPGLGKPPGVRREVYFSDGENHECGATSSDFSDAYGVTLRPARLELWFVLSYSLLFLISLSGGLLVGGFDSKLTPALLTSYLIPLFLYLLIIYFMPNLIGDIINKWPRSRYDLFQAIAEFMPTGWQANKMTCEKRSNESCWYWRPDKAISRQFQPIHYQKGQGSLQEVLYRLAIFEFLFDIRDPKGALRFRSWIVYIWSPIILPFIGVLFSLLFFYVLFVIDPSLDDEFKKHLGFFIWIAFVWAAFSFYYVRHWIKELKVLTKSIRKGEYNESLDGLPKQILFQLELLPEEQHIENAIKDAGLFIDRLITVVLGGFLVSLEVFSNIA